MSTREAATWLSGAPRTLARTGLPARRLLVLYQHTVPGRLRSTLQQKLHVLEHSLTRHEVVYWNAAYAVPRAVRSLDVDAILLDTTLLEARWAPEFGARRPTFDWLAETRTPKIAFPQDEYDHAHVLDDWLADLAVDVIFSVYGPAEHALLYPRCAGTVRFERCLTGYVDEADVSASAACVLPHRQRPLDLAYRAKRMSFRYGRLGQLKHEVGEAVKPLARERGLRVDISTDPADAILGDRWFPFVASARAVLGVESGSGAVDRRGELRAEEARYLELPGATFEDFAARREAGWDDHALQALGPRHLEAAAALSTQLLVEGRYEDAFEPGVHYVPLRADLADVDAALAALEDHATIEAMAVQTYLDVILSGRFSYAVLAARLEQVLADVCARGGADGDLGRARAAAAAYNLVVVRPPRWALRAVERTMPDATAKIMRARARWFERFGWP